MPRPRKYDNHKIEAYELYTKRVNAGEDVSALDIQVDLEEKHPEGTASYRLVANWVKEWKNISEWQALMDSPFQWRQMDKCGLPWEAGSYLLDIRYNLLTWWEAIYEASERRLARKNPPRLTAREAIWCWRVHVADPQIGTEVGCLEDLYVLAQQFAFRELARDVLAQPLYMDDLEALLVFKPWRDFGGEDERHQAYHRAVDEGVVPPVPSRDAVIDDARRIWYFARQAKPTMQQHWWTAVGTYSIDHPELLMSQQTGLLREQAKREEKQ